MLQLQRQHRAVVRIRKKHEQEWCPDTVRNVFRDSARKERQPFIVAYRGYAPAFCDIDRIRKCDSLRLHSRASARHGSWSSLRSHEKVSSCEPPFFPWFGIQIDGVSSMELRFLTCRQRFGSYVLVQILPSHYNNKQMLAPARHQLFVRMLGSRQDGAG